MPSYSSVWLDEHVGKGTRKRFRKEVKEGISGVKTESRRFCSAKAELQREEQYTLVIVFDLPRAMGCAGSAFLIRTFAARFLLRSRPYHFLSENIPRISSKGLSWHLEQHLLTARRTAKHTLPTCTHESATRGSIRGQPAAVVGTPLWPSGIVPLMMTAARWTRN